MFMAELLPTSAPAETPRSQAGSPETENLHLGALSEQFTVGSMAYSLQGQTLCSHNSLRYSATPSHCSSCFRCLSLAVTCRNPGAGSLPSLLEHGRRPVGKKLQECNTWSAQKGGITILHRPNPSISWHLSDQIENLDNVPLGQGCLISYLLK